MQDIFNHSASSITLKYIGINDDIKDNTIENFYLFKINYKEFYKSNTLAIPL
ncbi:hypothetical protein [Clostridium botulinum]|uniref:hypothetical protein n=1 Tax=Clostridium botulinum TaxID=1491 RepID=UPI003DA3EA4E